MTDDALAPGDGGSGESLDDNTTTTEGNVSSTSVSVASVHSISDHLVEKQAFQHPLESRYSET